jgi:tetratricopeptide (TPR) repeat protein
MHLAIVIESSYRENEQLAELPGAHASAELVSARLTQAGFVVERIPASRELAGYLDERLLGATSPLTSLLVYYVGYVALNPERGPALLLDGPRLRAFPVSRVARAIMGAAYSGAFVVDAVAVPEPNQTAQQIARSIVDVVPAEGRVATLVAAKEPDPARAWMPSRLSDLFVLGLDWLDAAEADPRTVTLAALSRVMREERISYARVGATASHFGEDAFALLPGRLAARPSETVRRVQRDVAPPSDPVASWAPRSPAGPLGDAPLPSFENPEPSTDSAEPLPSFEDPGPSTDPSEPLPSFSDAESEPAPGEALPSFADRALREPDPEAVSPLPPYIEPAPFAVDADEPEAAPLPSFADVDPSAEEPTPERSSVLPSPAARQRMSSRPSHGSTDPDALAALVAGYDRAEQYAEAVGAREDLAACLVGEPARRAYVLEDAARIAAQRLGDRNTAIRLAKEALDVDPTALGALELAATELGASEEWDELTQVYEGVLARLQNGPIAARIAVHLGTIRHERLGDLDGAARALERALACEAHDPGVHRRLAEIHEARGETLWAIRRRRAETRVAPGSTGAYAAALGLFASTGDVDAAWNASAALVALGGADDRTRAIYESFRDGGLLRVERGLTHADWTSGLLDPDRDAEMSDLLAIAEGVAVRARLEQLRRARTLALPPESARHDPEKSTAMLARSLLWTSKLLGIDAPALYVVDDTEHMAAAPAAVRTSVVSRSLGSGLALGELSFLWGRHLTFLCGEHNLLTFFPTARDVGNVLFALRAAVAADRRVFESLDGETRDLARGIERSLDPGMQRDVARRVERIDFAKVPERARAWARGVERLAGRIGLLACGDAAVATSLVARFPLTGLLTPREQSEDLLAYSISAEYGEMRARLGAQVHSDARRVAG